MTAADWLVVPQQRLLSLTAGAVFHDDLGLEAVRARLRYYPHDVWLYQQAAAWSAIGQDEHLAPRAGMVGDDLGSRLITARVCRTAVQLALLQERRYAPYDKWLGTALARLDSTAPLRAAMAAALAADGWQERQERLGDGPRRAGASAQRPRADRRRCPNARPRSTGARSRWSTARAIARRLVGAVTDPEVRGARPAAARRR